MAMKKFLERAKQTKYAAEEVRRDNFARLVGTDRFPLLKDLAKALEYDPSRASHLRSGLKRITAELARGFEEKLGLEAGYFDEGPKASKKSTPATAAPVPAIPHVSAAARQFAVERYMAKEATAKALAKEYGVTEPVIYQWITAARREATGQHPVMMEPEIELPITHSADRTTDLERENQALKKKLLELMLKS